MATLTGAIVVALGSTHAGLMGDDDDWCARSTPRPRATGELVWRLPLHPEYAELIKGRYADIVNADETRKAGSITAARVPARASPATCRGRTSTSPAWPGTAASAYAPRAARAGRALLVELARRRSSGG